MSKESIVFYKEWLSLINSLSNENKLKFYENIFTFEEGNLPEIEDPHLKSVFDFISLKIVNNNKKYKDKCDKARESAKARWNNKNDANACERIKRIKTHYDNDNDNVNDNVNDNITPTNKPNINPPTPLKEEKGVLKQSFKEKGSWSINDVLCQLDDDAESKIKENAPGWCIDLLATKYVEWINSGRRAPPTSVKKAFPVWCKTYTKGKTPF